MNNGLNCPDLCGDANPNQGTNVDWFGTADAEAFCRLVSTSFDGLTHTADIYAPAGIRYASPAGDSYPYCNPQSGGSCTLNANGAKSGYFAGNGDSSYGDAILCKCAVNDMAHPLPYAGTNAPCA